MTDREFLEAQLVAIDKQLQKPTEGPVSFRLPREPWQETPKGWFAGWFNPMPIFEKNTPVICQGFSDKHEANDIAYLNWLGMPASEPQTFGGPDDDRYLVPSDKVIVYAPGAGRIWDSGEDIHGWHVRLDNGDYVGFPLNTFITHMSELFVPEHEGPNGPYVYAGQPLGICGAGNTHANHVHFAMYDFGEDGKPLDPALYLPHFGTIIQEKPCRQ